MRWKRWVVIVLIAAGVIAALAWGLRPQPVLVEVDQATRGLLRVTVEEEGKTRLKDSYIVSAPIAGNMERISLDAGDPVRSSQFVTEIAPSPPPFLDPRAASQMQAELNSVKARVDAAEQRVRAASANNEYAQTELNRLNALLKSGDVPRSRYDQAVTEQRQTAAALREAEAALEGAEADLARAQAALVQPGTGVQKTAAKVRVVAPIAGRVLRVLREHAGPVNSGEQLIEVGDARALEVEIEVLSTDAVKIGPGTPVIFTRWGGDAPLEGAVQIIEPSGRTKVSALGVEEQRVSVIAIITSPETKWKGLGAGYRVEASFVIWEGKDILQIPSSALFRFNGGWAVFVVQDGVARRRPVKLGHSAGLRVEIVEGLTPDEQIIAHPDSSISDGTLVKANAAGEKGPGK